MNDTTKNILSIVLGISAILFHGNAIIKQTNAFISKNKDAKTNTSHNGHENKSEEGGNYYKE